MSSPMKAASASESVGEGSQHQTTSEKHCPPYLARERSLNCPSDAAAVRALPSRNQPEQADGSRNEEEWKEVQEGRAKPRKTGEEIEIREKGKEQFCHVIGEKLIRSVTMNSISLAKFMALIGLRVTWTVSVSFGWDLSQSTASMERMKRKEQSEWTEETKLEES